MFYIAGTKNGYNVRKKKLFIVVNVDYAFLSHRLPIALAAQKSGYDVTIVTSNTGRIKEIESHGLKYIEHPIRRGGMNIFNELYGLLFFIKLYYTEKPQILHHVGLKIFLYGSLAARLFKIPNVNAISGLGYLFTENKYSLIKNYIFKLISILISGNKIRYIFQNQDDKCLLEKYFSSMNIENCTTIKGSGVDLKYFDYVQEPLGSTVKILFSARILGDKGIREFVKAAELLKPKLMGKAKFIIAGAIDDENPTRLSEDDVRHIEVIDYIEWVGYQKKIKEKIEESHIVVLPSYREGLPKSLIEACAIGRPIVTTNAPGCKDVVIEGENGFLVPIKDYVLLSQRIEQLVDSQSLRTFMGINSRKLAELQFSIENVVSKHLEMYKSLH